MMNPLRRPIFLISSEAGNPAVMVPTSFNTNGSVASALFAAIAWPTREPAATVKLATDPVRAKQVAIRKRRK